MIRILRAAALTLALLSVPISTFAQSNSQPLSTDLVAEDCERDLDIDVKAMFETAVSSALSRQYPIPQSANALPVQISVDPVAAANAFYARLETEIGKDALKTLDMFEGKVANAKYQACIAHNAFIAQFWLSQRDAAVQNVSLHADQRWESLVLLFLVALAVVLSLGFAGYQLWVAARVGRAPDSSKAALSAKEIRITSSSVGVILFGLALLFIQMFLNHVYDIHGETLGTAPSIESK